MTLGVATLMPYKIRKMSVVKHPKSGELQIRATMEFIEDKDCWVPMGPDEGP